MQVWRHINTGGDLQTLISSPVFTFWEFEGGRGSLERSSLDLRNCTMQKHFKMLNNRANLFTSTCADTWQSWKSEGKKKHSLFPLVQLIPL